jgi:hypothetical protein
MLRRGEKSCEIEVLKNARVAPPKIPAQSTKSNGNRSKLKRAVPNGPVP